MAKKLRPPGPNRVEQQFEFTWLPVLLFTQKKINRLMIILDIQAEIVI